MVKLCKDCRYYLPYRVGPDCISPNNGVHLTDGGIKTAWAEHSRSHISKCGTSANWFEQKEVVTVQFDPSFFDKLRSWFTNKE